MLRVAILVLLVTTLDAQDNNGTLDNSTTVENGESNIIPSRPFWMNVMNRILGRKSVCYGQFAYLRDVPESPDLVGTIFYLYPRKGVMPIREELLKEESLGIKLKDSSPESLANSGFDPESPTKILLHVTVDWEHGARRPNYFRAVANGELVARQVSRLVLNMVALGARPRDVHLIGFSLGAQVASFTGAALKKKKLKVVDVDKRLDISDAELVDVIHTDGSIMWMDGFGILRPLGHVDFFPNGGQNQPGCNDTYISTLLTQFLDVDKRLDISDAELVDVIHTDGSIMWMDGFGILRPVGHVDFFPNGGQNQPGCNDTYISTLLTQFPQTDNVGLHCSHTRSIDLFLESLEDGCNFVGFPCPNIRSFSRNFVHGNCFSCEGNKCATMGGKRIKGSGRGSLYLTTRSSPPFCGQQIRVAVNISGESQMAQGSIFVQLNHGNSNTSFELKPSGFFTEMLGIISGGQEISSVVAAMPRSLHPLRTPVLTAILTFQPGLSLFSADHIIVNRMVLLRHKYNTQQFQTKINTTDNTIDSN
ncbi:hypothetical protein B566_EDAN010713 [Ephemera danica]|nr:hypothetical protein B566_EDAN010713 [Ephemera danica]